MEDQREERGRCSRPPSLDDLALIAAVDGEAGEEIRAHLRACPDCARRAREFDELQGFLRQRLYRVLCPSSEQLADYQQGWLGEPLRTEIRAHLRDCPHCADELRLLAEAAHPPPEPAPISRLRRVVARPLATGPRSPFPVYGALRGAAHGGQYAYRADNLELTLDVGRAAVRNGRLVLVGMLLNEDGLADGLNRATASLLSNDLVVSSAVLDDLGSFILEDIEPGDYSLSLRLPEFEIVVEALSL